MVFGLNLVYQRRINRAVIIESEIDAMYLWSAGIPAIAMGGSVFSEEKAELLRKSPLEEAIAMTDHDEAGQKLKRAIIAGLGPYVRVSVAGYPYRYKDPNEIGDLAKVKGYVERARGVRWKTALLSA
ncbi:toprim domain-containing protein [Brevibacillus daliensis]|uniref:toprim domain-containing protein n=1 Tax=Brevibacillus daliensis TaxID=2892995 RepID=UPI001E61385B|nr:toprim domain-containing protein [Brevibacillus daliensis]